MEDLAASTHALSPDDEIAKLRVRLATLEQHVATNGSHAAQGDTPHERRYRILADAMPQLVWATDANGSHMYFNQRWYEYTGLSEEESMGFGFAKALHPEDQERTLAHWRQAWHDGGSYEIEYRFRRHDGVYQWFMGRAVPVRDADGLIVEWVGTCTNIDDQKRNEIVQTFLSEASDLLSASLNYEDTLQKVARLAVPQIADWCSIDMRESDGSIRRVAVAHVDPEKVAIAALIQSRLPYNPNSPTGVPAVLRSGKSELFPVITDEMIRKGVKDPELQEAFLSLHLRSSMIVPLKRRDSVLGTITLIAAESERLFNADDMQLAEELARRAATAIENAQLYQELDQFKMTLDDTLDCVFMCDPDTLQLVYVNQGAIDHVGYSREELLHMTPLDIKPEFDETSYRALIEPLRNGILPSSLFQTVHRHKDGHLIPVEIAFQYIQPPSGQARFVAIVRDISERKRVERELRSSERRYRALADAMPLVVWTADAQGNVTYFNQRWIEYTGMSLEESIGWGWEPVIHPQDIGKCLERWTTSVRTGQLYEIEYRFRRADGEYRWFLGRAVPVHNDEGVISFWVGSGTDIDEQKRTEKTMRDRAIELARITRMLETRNRELDHFAYVTSHDLKAPLRGIANLSQWIEEDLGEHATADIQKQMELLRGRVHRMEALIDGILQYSRVGRVKNSVERVDVAALLDDIIDLQAPPPGFTITVGPDMPTFNTERVALQQVFTNLISNAIKHHDRHDGTITIDVEDADDLYAFRVSDDGPGIAPEYHERIFVIFQTLAPRDKVEGSGLGLSLVKKIVETEGGTITVESSEGHGTTFRFTWPKIPPEQM